MSSSGRDQTWIVHQEYPLLQRPVTENIQNRLVRSINKVWGVRSKI